MPHCEVLFFTDRRVVILLPPDNVRTFFGREECRRGWEVDQDCVLRVSLSI